MFRFVYTDTGCRSVTLKDELHDLAFIDYAISGAYLQIESFERNGIADYIYHDTHYFGTDVFNALLLHLQDLSIPVETIAGTLSYADAYKNNWKKSIPFYSDFPKHLDPKISYSLRFHLYDDTKQTKEIFLPNNRYDRMECIEKMRQNHLTSEKSASFMYEVDNEMRLK